MKSLLYYFTGLPSFFISAFKNGSAESAQCVEKKIGWLSCRLLAKTRRRPRAAACLRERVEMGKTEIRLEGRGQKSEIGKYANQLSKRLALPVQENWRNARQYDKPARPVSDLRPLKSDL